MPSLPTTSFVAPLSVSAMLAALAARQVSAEELVRDAVARITAQDGTVNAVVLPDFERAMAQARASDAARAAGLPLGVLAGVPVTIKESFDVAGLPTSWGISECRDQMPTRDSAVAARMRAAGAIILGKTNVSAALAGWSGRNPVYGQTENPMAPGHTAGGSSAGSAAAVAAGFVPLDVGSDLAGSIRVPAHFCGVFGHVASHGAISRRGHIVGDYASVVDLSCPGPLAREAADLALALSALIGPDEDHPGWKLDLPLPRHARLADYRVLVMTQHPLAPTDPEIAAQVDQLAVALGRAGAQVVPAEGIVPDSRILTYNFADDMAAALTMPLSPQVMASRAAALASRAPDDAGLAARMARAALMSHYQWLQVREQGARIRAAWRDVFRAHDVLICPPFSMTAPPWAQVDAPDVCIDGRTVPKVDLMAWSAAAIGAGLPVTVLPAGRSSAGLPIGVQVIAPRFEDRTGIHFAGLCAELLERDGAQAA